MFGTNQENIQKLPLQAPENAILSTLIYQLSGLFGANQEIFITD